MVTKREFEAQLRYMENPPKMCMADALKAVRPEFEIGIRVAAKEQELTSAEGMFFAAESFLGDTLNGGLIQSLCNDTGSMIGLVIDFAKEYCDEQVFITLSEIRGVFPGENIPKDRIERNELIEVMSNDFEIDPFDEITLKLYALEDKYIAGLLKLALDRSEEFTCLA